MKKAVYAGTFDPLTKGHLDVIERSSKLCDELVILIANNHLKNHKFTLEERVLMIENVTKHLKNIKIDSTAGLVVDYAEKNDIEIMIRGLRNIQDYEYEYSLAKYNYNINSSVETILLFPSSSNHFVSSSAIKELVYHNVDISLYIPKENIELVTERLKAKL